MNLMRVVHSMLRVQPMEPRWPLSCAFSFAIRRGSFTPGLSLVWVHLSVTGLPFIYFLAPLSTTMRSLSNVVFIISLLITCITTWQFTDWFSLPRTNVVRISFRLGPSLRSPKRLIILRFLFPFTSSVLSFLNPLVPYSFFCLRLRRHLPSYHSLALLPSPAGYDGIRLGWFGLLTWPHLFLYFGIIVPISV